MMLLTKPDCGTKRTCPKCGTRFYDLTKDEPVTCISCAYAWHPEPVLKSKQPMPYEEQQPGTPAAAPDSDLGGDLADDLSDIDVDEDAEVSPDDEVDLGGDDDLGVDTGESQEDI